MHEKTANTYIHIEFGTHGESDGHLLDPMAKLAEVHLGVHPRSKVIFVLERIGYAKKNSAAILSWTRAGMLVSDAYAQYDYLEANDASTLPSAETLATWKQQHFGDINNKDPFLQQELQIIDTLQEKFPGRVVVFPEWSLPREVSKMWIYEHYVDKSRDLVIKGRFDEGLFLYRRYMTPDTDLILGRRDKRLIGLFNTILHYVKDWDDSLVVSYLGSDHTGVFHELERQRAKISRSFPEKQGEYLLYPPDSVIRRRLRFFPNRQLSELEWLRTLVIDTIYDTAIDYKERRGHRMTEQAIIRAIYNDLPSRLDTEEKIRRFEEDIRNIGYYNALYKLANS